MNMPVPSLKELAVGWLSRLSRSLLCTGLQPRSALGQVPSCWVGLASAHTGLEPAGPPSTV